VKAARTVSTEGMEKRACADRALSLSTGKCVPVPQDACGKSAIHYTTVYKVFAKWADDGSLWQAFLASVAHLAAEKHLDVRVLHGDGTNTVAKKGVMALATRATNTRRVRRSLPSPTTMAMS
jgi:hypothetical protein